MPGVYTIVYVGDNGCKWYIGETICLYDRMSRHLSELRSNEHGNEHIQRAFNKYGEDNFYCAALQIYTGDALPYDVKTITKGWEKQWYDMLCTNGYSVTNIREPDGKSYGLHSAESKRKMSESHKGKHLTPEHKQKLSESKRGKHRKPFTEETRKKMSESRRGDKCYKAKLTWDIVRYVRNMYLDGTLPSQKQVATILGVDISTVSRILYNKIWCDGDYALALDGLEQTNGQTDSSEKV